MCIVPRIVSTGRRMGILVHASVQVGPISLSNFSHIQVLLRSPLCPVHLICVSCVESEYGEANTHEKASSDDDEEDNQRRSELEAHVISLMEIHSCSCLEIHFRTVSQLLRVILGGRATSE